MGRSKSRGGSLQFVRVVLVASGTVVAASATAQTNGSARTGTGSAAAGAGSSAASNTQGTASRGSASPGRFDSDRPIATQQLEVSTGATPAGNNAPTAAMRTEDSSSQDQVTGPIGPGDAARLVNAQMPRMRPCYDRAVPAHPGLQGRLELRFTIAADGRVTQARVYGMNEAPEVATCLQQVLQTTTFPRPQGGSLPFIYPVTFAPAPNLRAGRTRGRPAPRTAAATTRSTPRAN